MNDPLAILQQQIGYKFQRADLIALAVTHPSLSNESPDHKESNQRLEFLGDAVLQLILSEEIYRLYPHEREGALTQRRKKLIEGRFTAELAREIGLSACLRVPPAAAELAQSQSALEDAFEALVAAVYLDGGYARCREVVLTLYGDLTQRLATVLPADNPKGRLQEIVQPLHGNHALRYQVVATTGEAHAREFEITLYLNEQLLATGHGTSKQRAEEAAARAALNLLSTSSAE